MPSKAKTVDTLRITATTRGQLATYIREEMEVNGDTAGRTLVDLAMRGMEYKESIKSLAAIGAAANLEAQKGASIAKSKKSG